MDWGIVETRAKLGAPVFGLLQGVASAAFL